MGLKRGQAPWIAGIETESVLVDKGYDSDVNRAAIRAALYSTKELAGAYGVYNFTPASTYGVDERSVTLVKIDNGAWKLLPAATP